MKSNENAIDLRRFFRQAKKSIWVYIGSLIFFGALAGYYIYRAMPQYVVEGAMLIEDSSEEASALKSAGPLSACLLYTSPSPRDPKTSRMPSSA